MNTGSDAEIRPRLACADSAFPKLSHDVALQVIRDLGVGAVDICVFPVYGHTAPADVHAEPIAAADAVLPRLERAGLAVADVFLILGGFQEVAVNHPDAEVRRDALAHFEQAVRFAGRLGAPGLTVLPGADFDGVRREDGLRLAAQELERRAQIAGEAGLALSIEPHYQSIVETPDRTLELLELAPAVMLALDYSQFVYQGIAQDDVTS
jgi:sugar phosphate isomerase/epimerase